MTSQLQRRNALLLLFSMLAQHQYARCYATSRHYYCLKTRAPVRCHVTNNASFLTHNLENFSVDELLKDVENPQVRRLRTPGTTHCWVQGMQARTAAGMQLCILNCPAPQLTACIVLAPTSSVRMKLWSIHSMTAQHMRTG